MKLLKSLFAFLLILPQVYGQVDCIKGDCYNGRGTCVYPNGARYVGEFRMGRIHGQGILFFSNGDKYIGNWVDQFREGEGRLVFVNGDEYLGNFVRNQFSGKGAMTYANGGKYEGDWKNDRPNGKGIFSYANGNRYEGMFRDGQYDGAGTLTYAGGGRFTGQWVGNRRQGAGTLYLPTGESISGQWVDDQYQADWSGLSFRGDTTFLRDCNSSPCGALGKRNLPGGVRYTGEFRNDQPDGIGTAYYASGDRYEGQWKGDKPEGRGVMYFSSGKVLGAYWLNGTPSYELFVRQRAGKGQPVATIADQDVRVWAVIVGAATYTHMPTLRYTDDDAYQLYAFLKSPEGGALPDDQVRLLIDENATRANIFDAMKNTFLRADDNDEVVFYFSGHGLPGAFLPVDYDGKTNLVEHESIKQLLASSRAKHKLVIADACHSGTLQALRAGSSTAAALQKYYQALIETNGGTALLMSSKGEEYSLEDGGLRSGIFSHFLVKGLKGGADVDGDRIVTITELFDFVYQKVRQYTGNVQTPILTGMFDRQMPVAVVR